VYEFNKIDDVIKFINARPKPLALYYFGRSLFNENKEKLKTNTSSGAFVINEACFHLLNNDLPFGGVGNSGLGAYHGQTGFDNCSHLKPVFDKAPLNIYPYSSRYPPYNNFKIGTLKFLFKYANVYERKVLKALMFISLMIAGTTLYKKGKFDPMINGI